MTAINKLQGSIQGSKFFAGHTGVVDKRVEISFDIIVKDSNPNGDPDRDNEPRTDSMTEEGLITGECMKSKIRAYLGEEHPDTKLLLVRGMESLEDALKTAGPHLDYYDVRTFGAVLAVKEKEDDKASDKGKDKSSKKGKEKNIYTGAIQMSLGKSVGPVRIEETTITRGFSTKSGTDKTRTMGRRKRVVFGVYHQSIWVNPAMARKNNFTWEDLELFLEALRGAFAYDKSTARPDIKPLRVVVFEHSSSLGDCSDETTLVRATPTRINPDKHYAESLEDFDMKIREENIPGTVKATLWEYR